MLNLTTKQTIISDFLYHIYLESDSNELDEWLVYLARENGDEQLAKMIGGNTCDQKKKDIHGKYNQF